MKTRIVHTRFWNDNLVCKLNPKEKLVFIYLLTNERNNLIGIYELSDKHIIADLGITPMELNSAKSKLSLSKKIIFYDGWIKIVNHEKYNSFNGEKIQVAKERELSEVPDKLRGMDTSMDTSMDTLNNQYNNKYNNNKEIVKEKTYTTNNLTLDQVAEGVLKAFSVHTGRNFKGINSFKSNLEYWLETYTPKEIEQAIKGIRYDEFWSDKMTPTILFRKKNPQGEQIDYISKLLVNSSNAQNK